MSATIITTTATATTTTTTTSSRQTRNTRFKSFLNRHCYIVDFLSAAITIVLCLTILLPRVHESFLPKNETSLVANASKETNNTLPINHQTAEQSNGGFNGELDQDSHEGDHQHHNHRFPTAELLICIGFFVFYCAGLGLGRPQVTGVDQELYLAHRRKQSATCCTTSRCSAPNNGSRSRRQSGQANEERTTILTSTGDQSSDGNCLMLINPHHQHHTHAKHHGHSHSSSANNPKSRKQRSNYGTNQKIITGQENYNAIVGDDDNIQVSPRPSATIVVDEIRITSGPELRRDQWPHSLGLLLFSLILALVLVFFDMNVLGMIRAVKVFRATSTGALLYVAFFIMLPLKQNHCNSCEKEEEDTYIMETSN